MNFIDTHSHLYGEEFKEDIDDVIQRAQAVGVQKIFLPNINESTIGSMIALSRRYPGYLYPMLGLHPTDLDKDYRAVLERMHTMLQAEHQFIGIGEVGLDYYWDKTYYHEQQDAFRIQLEWAHHYELPLMIHSRSAHVELVDIMESCRDKKQKGVFHSFSGTLAEAQQLLSFDNFLLGINGTLTFKKSTLPEVLLNVPLNRIVLETDSPYLSPMPRRGKRNESAHLAHTLHRLAEVYNLPIEEVAQQTTANALLVFTRAK